jgi:hypothetical protein
MLTEDSFVVSGTDSQEICMMRNGSFIAPGAVYKKNLLSGVLGVLQKMFTRFISPTYTDSYYSSAVI